MSSFAKNHISRWFSLGVGSLLFGGLLSLVLILGRIPGIENLGFDALWAKRCLVVHVNMTLTSWFFSLLATFFYLIPGEVGAIKRKLPYLALLGLVLITACGLFLPSLPILSNYIPAIDHPLFSIGFVVCFLAIFLSLMDRRLWFLPEKGEFLPRAATRSVQWAALLYMAGILSVLLAVFSAKPSEPASYYEILFWGGGHIFQLSHVASLLGCWFFLLRREFDFSQSVFSFIHLPLVVGGLFGLSIMFNGTTENSEYYSSFALIMRWATWPSLVLFVLFLITTPRIFPRIFHPTHGGFLMSFLLISLGIFLGVMIDSSSTLIPAHYHATIGALTVAYMAGGYEILDCLGVPIRPQHRRIQRIQPFVYGVGQFIFSSGFAAAGWFGLGRKVYGSEQTGMVWQQKVGLAIMGVGGVMALIGGGLFLYLAISCLSRYHRNGMARQSS